MIIGSYQITKYVCQCDNCKKIVEIEKTENIYNGAQAVRSINWAFTRDKKVICKNCRMKTYKDNYKYR